MTVAVVLATAPAIEGRPAAALPWHSAAPAAESPDGTLLQRLLGQLGDLAVRRVHVVTRPEWAQVLKPLVAAASVPVRLHVSASPAQDLSVLAELAAATRAPIVVLPGDVVTHREALAGLLADPRVVSGVLTGRARRRGVYRTRSARGRVASAGSPYHSVRGGNASFLGVLKIGPRDRDALVTVATRLAELLADRPGAWEEELERKALRWRAATGGVGPEDATADSRHEERVEAAADENELPADGEPAERGSEIGDSVAEPVWLARARQERLRHRIEVARQDVVPLLLVGLVREGVHVTNSYLRKLFWARPLSRDAAAAAAVRINAFDEDRVLLDSAVKANDGFFTTYFVSPYSKYLACWAARRGWSPNLVTTISMIIGVLAAVAFSTGSRGGLIAGAVLLQLAFTADCVDGQLARYTRTFSKLGAWLDSVFDRGKEYVVFAGLALGSARGFGDDVWVLAGAALTLQTARHFVDFSYSADQHVSMGTLARLPLEQPSDRVGRPDSPRSAADPGMSTPSWAADRVEPLPAASSGAPSEQRSTSSVLLVADHLVAEPATVGAPTAAPRRDLLTTLARRAIRVSRSLERRPWTRWAKKILVLPIGERFALISLTAALSTPRTTFLVLITWGSLAAAYGVTGRVLRSVVR